MADVVPSPRHRGGWVGVRDLEARGAPCQETLIWGRSVVVEEAGTLPCSRLGHTDDQEETVNDALRLLASIEFEVLTFVQPENASRAHEPAIVEPAHYRGKSLGT